MACNKAMSLLACYLGPALCLLLKASRFTHEVQCKGFLVFALQTKVTVDNRSQLTAWCSGIMSGPIIAPSLLLPSFLPHEISPDQAMARYMVWPGHTLKGYGDARVCGAVKLGSLRTVYAEQQESYVHCQSCGIGRSSLLSG